MKVDINSLDVSMELKNNGMELAVRDTDGTYRGKLFITRTGLVWCHGKTTRVNGIKLSWNKFIDRMDAN